MKRIGPVVLRQPVGPAIERKATARDAIGVAADNNPEIGRVRNPLVECLEAQHDVAQPPVTVGCPDGMNRGVEVVLSPPPWNDTYHVDDGRILMRDGGMVAAYTASVSGMSHSASYQSALALAW